MAEYAASQVKSEFFPSHAEHRVHFSRLDALNNGLLIPKNLGRLLVAMTRSTTSTIYIPNPLESQLFTEENSAQPSKNFASLPEAVDDSFGVCKGLLENAPADTKLIGVKFMPEEVTKLDGDGQPIHDHFVPNDNEINALDGLATKLIDIHAPSLEDSSRTGFYL